MNKSTKFTAFVVAICMIMAPPVFAFEEGQISDISQMESNVLFVTEQEHDATESNQVVKESFDAEEISVLASYDLISLESKALAETLDKNMIQQLLDNGSVFYVPVSTVGEGVDVFENLSNAVWENERELTGAIINGVYVYNDNGRYRFSMHAVRELIPEDANAADTVAVGTEVNAGKKDLVSYDGIINHVHSLPISSRNAYLDRNSESAVEVQLPTKTFDHVESDTVSLYRTLLGIDITMGSITITQYAYNICLVDNGDETKTDYYDVVTSFLIDADVMCAVDTYTGTISANYSNLEIVDAEPLEDDTVNTITLTGGIEANTDEVISGSIGGSTSYSYNSHDQEINNDLAIDDKECNWKATPIEDIVNESWKLEPAARIRNLKGGENLSGACSSLSDAKIWFLEHDGSGLRYTMTNLPVEISQFWSAGTSET